MVFDRFLIVFSLKVGFYAELILKGCLRFLGFCLERDFVFQLGGYEGVRASGFLIGWGCMRGFMVSFQIFFVVSYPSDVQS